MKAKILILFFWIFKCLAKPDLICFAELEKAPHVIFTTAYDEYALKAFEVNALDYLLKPVEPNAWQMLFIKLQFMKAKNQDGDA